MTTEEASELRIGDELTYPKNWPASGNLELKKPVVVINLTRSNWSQTHVLVGLATANGKTTQMDAAWFDAPARVAAKQTEESFEF